MACPVCQDEKVIDCVECQGEGDKFPLWPSRMKKQVCMLCEGQKQIECPVCSGKKRS